MAATQSLTPAMLEAILQGPAMIPPPGVISNFINPPSFGTAMLVVEIIFLILPTLSIFIRLWTNIRINRKAHLEDYLSLLAWGIYVGLYVPARLAAQPAGGRHQWNVQVKDISGFLYNLHIGSTMYGSIIFFIKASILLQYIRIFSSGDRGIFFWSCHTLIWLNFVFYTASIFLEIFSCRPLAKALDPLITTDTCLSVMDLNIAAASINVASDFTIFLLPQPIIWGLHMTVKKRLGVSLIFAAALLVCISAAIRLYYCVLLSRSDDITYYVSMMATYMFPELGIGIMISCLPSVPKFFRTLGETKTFSRMGTTLYALLGLSKIGRTTGHSSGNTKPPRIQQPSDDNARMDKFDRLIEEHELLSRNNSAGDTITEEVDVSSVNSRIPKESEIIRTVNIATESRPELDGNLPRTVISHGRLWQGNHDYKATIAT